MMIDIEHSRMLKKIFLEYCPNAEIWAYGSRVKHQSHAGSDLDLVVKTFGDDGKSIGELYDLLNDSDIPFLIDIHEFDRLPKYFQDEILKQHEIIFGSE